MSMTKKDFILIADSIRPLFLKWDDVEYIADKLAESNIRFNKDKWINYVFYFERK